MAWYRSVLAAAVLSAAAPPAIPAAAECVVDDTCPYKCCRRRKEGFPCYCSACCTGKAADASRASTPARVFVSHGRLAAVYHQRIDFYELRGAEAMVDGRPAAGPLAPIGILSIDPSLAPVKSLSFGEPIARPSGPQPNGERFLVCTDPELRPLSAIARADFKRFCGIVDLQGRRVYSAPAPRGNEFIEALALGSEGREALFAYGSGRSIDRYLHWSEGRRPVSLKNDPRDTRLRALLERLGQEGVLPEP